MEKAKKKKLRSARIIATNIFMGFSILVIVAIVLLIAMGYSFTKDGNLEQSGLLQVNSTPSGATVTIDDIQQFSRTNMSKMLTSGLHHVTVTKTNYDTWEKELNIEAGLLTRLDWVRLFPVDPVIENVHTYNSLRLTSASPNHQYLIILPEHTSEAQLINIQNDEIIYQTINLASIFNLPNDSLIEGELKISQWNKNGDKFLLTWKNLDNVAWYLVDIKTPTNSVNLTNKFSLNFQTILPASDSADKLWALENQNLRLINLKDSTISSVLVDGVSELTNYLTTVAYLRQTTSPTTNQTISSINLYKEGENTDIVLRKLENNITDVKIALGNYWGDEWIAYTLNNRFYLQSGDFPSAGKPTSSLKTIAEHDLDFVPNLISVNPTHRLISVAQSQSLATYDLELRELSSFEVDAESTSISWLDDFLLWEVYDQQLIVRDFDGDNRRSITAAINASVVLTENNRWIYYFNSAAHSETTDQSYILQRLRL